MRSDSLRGDSLQHRQPRLLLLGDEGEDLVGRHGARIATGGGEPFLDIRIVEDFVQVRAHFAYDRCRRADRRHQNKPAGRGNELVEPVIKKTAEMAGIAVFQPEDKIELTNIIHQLKPGS